MSARDDGGPAFPMSAVPARPGMTLRDYFAAAIAPAVIAELGKAQGIGSPTFWSNVSAHIKTGADAMIRERAK